MGPDESTTTGEGEGGIDPLENSSPASSDENPAPADITASTNAAAPESGDGGDESLDDDQQMALENILAQIEDDGADDVDADSGKAIAAEPDAEPVDGISAELEIVVNPAEADQQAVTQDTDILDADDAHIEDQQKENAAGQLEDETHADTQDISEDIEDILKEIISNDDESTLPEKATDEPVGPLGDNHALEKAIPVDDIVAHRKEDKGPVPEDSLPAAPPDGENGPTAVLDENPPANDPPDPQPGDKYPASVRLQASPKAQPLREATQSMGRRQKKTILVSVVVIILLFLAPNFYQTRNGHRASRAAIGVTDPTHPDLTQATQSIPLPPESPTVNRNPSEPSRLKTAIANLDRLRNEMLEKQAEVEELRAYYQTGIDEEIQGLIDTVHQVGHGKLTIKTALADPRISLGLSAIQRRDTYIRKLAIPAKNLLRNSEALLFFSRKAGLLTLMAGKTSDIDIDGFIKQADEIIDVHGRALAQLNIDAIPVAALDLESIWQDIAKRLSATPAVPEKKPTVMDSDNAAIWKKICDGDFTQKDRLTALSTEAARCLATWKGRDLFLNGLSDLRPDAARQLTAWEGDWLGLNGLKDLSPEVAMHLSKWKGKGLSLNGLSRLSPRVVAILSEWQGEQIEIVNVKTMAHWENPQTRLFLSEALQRKGLEKK